MKEKNDAELKLFKVKGLSIKTLKNIIQKSVQAIPGSRPQKIVVKHSEMSNSYKSLYRSQWNQEIFKTITIKRFISINTLVQKMYNNIKKLFQGTVYENNFFFYHDALSLMTSPSCKDFMKKTGIINHWILPQNKLNENTVYSNRPIGNSPEVMPLDCNLNKDLHEGVNWLCSITNRLDDSNPVKFSKTTSKRMLSAYARAWDTSLLPEGYPSAKRIVQDIDRVVDEAYL